MATTTPNFGWPVPTSTDLVKDGATAMEALGDAIDTSMVDLKGGTTGQVLSKNSNTDMDFVWVTDAGGDITGVFDNEAEGPYAGMVLTMDGVYLGIFNESTALTNITTYTVGYWYHVSMMAPAMRFCCMTSNSADSSMTAPRPTFTMTAWGRMQVSALASTKLRVLSLKGRVTTTASHDAMNACKSSREKL